ncbi:MAG: general secretion pathway protein GspD [Planctomycetaceae bacterium]|nr:MAG: general secretion pathway protein GspD [Planctomycetaceae bacterium]
MTKKSRCRRARTALLALLTAHFGATAPSSRPSFFTDHAGVVRAQEYTTPASGLQLSAPNQFQNGRPATDNFVPNGNPAGGFGVAHATEEMPVLNTIQMPAAFVAKVSTALELRYRDNSDVQVSPDARGGRLVILAPPSLQRQLQGEAMKIYVAESQPGASQTGVPEALASVVPDAMTAGVRTAGGQMQMRLSSIDWRQFEDSLQRVVGKRIPVTTSQNGQKAIFRLAGAPLDGTTVEVDRRENVVTVVAPEPAMPGWQKMIRSLDSAATKPGEVIEMVRVENAKPAPIQRALRLIDNLPKDAEATVTAVGGGGGGEQLRTAMLQPPPAGAPQQPPAFQLPDGEPGAAAGETAGIIGDTQIQFVPELGIIIVRGAKRDAQRVLDVIRQIEEQSAVTQPEVEIYQLKHLNDSAAAELLTQVYEEVLAARQGEVNIKPLDHPNALLLVGRRESVANALALIEKLDKPLDSSSRLRVFRLNHASATDAEETVRSFFTDRPGAGEDVRPGLGVRVRIVADYRTNSLVIGASPRDLAEVAILIRDLDVESVPAQNEIKVFSLRNSLAADLAPVIQNAINGDGEGGENANATRPSTSLSILSVDSQAGTMLSSGVLSGLVVTADANANAIIVRGPSSSMSLIGELIRQLDQVPGVETVVKVFTIENGDAVRLNTALQELFSQAAQGGGGQGVGQLSPATASSSSLVNLRFTTDQRTNSIIATGSASDLEVVESILLRLDTKGFAERVTEVIWLRHQSAPEIAAAITQYVQTRVQTANQIQQFQTGLGPYDLPDRDLVVVAEEVSNSLLLSVSPRLYPDVRQLIESLDRRPPMVLIKVVLAEVSLGDTFELGGELGLQDSLLFDRSVANIGAEGANLSPLSNPSNSGFNFNNAGTPNNAAINPGAVGSRALSTFGLGTASSAAGYGGFVLSAASDSFSLLLRALQDANRAQILSRPQIMTVDNKAGFVQVGQSVARVSGLQQGGVNFAPVLEVGDIDIGLILEVLPRVGADGLISMQIRAERSSIDDVTTGTPIGTDQNGNAIVIPNINRTTAESTIIAYSGQTVVFGGLIQKERFVQSRRVPYLSQIPLVGMFFRYDRETEERRELLVVMTPMLVNGDEDLEYVKQTESARMSYCLADVVEMHGDVGLSGGYGLWGPAMGPTIYPDVHPTVDQFPKAQPFPAEGQYPVNGRGERILSERVLGETPLQAPGVVSEGVPLQGYPQGGVYPQQQGYPQGGGFPPATAPYPQAPYGSPQGAPQMVPQTIPRGVPQTEPNGGVPNGGAPNQNGGDPQSRGPVPGNAPRTGMMPTLQPPQVGQQNGFDPTIRPADFQFIDSDKPSQY